jgi:CheY-like chemotaxis protein
MSVHVLVVEDQNDIRTEVVDLLKRAGYVVSWARDPHDAIERLERLPRPCILLWDAMIPRMSLTMVEKAVLEGVHVATIPVSVTPDPQPRSGGNMIKRLTSLHAILQIVEEHCPLPSAANA